MMGHVLPMENAASALRNAGHEVYFITNGNDAIKKKTASFEQKHGIQMVYTDCGLVQEDVYREKTGNEPNGLQAFMAKWLPYVRQCLE